MFADGESVHVTEKVDGLLGMGGFDPGIGQFVLCKQVTTAGIFLSPPHAGRLPEIRALSEAAEAAEEVSGAEGGRPVAFIGELAAHDGDEMALHVFDVVIGPVTQCLWLRPEDGHEIALSAGLSYVPLIASEMPFDNDLLVAMARRPSALNGASSEGIVVRKLQGSSEISGVHAVKYDGLSPGNC